MLVCISYCGGTRKGMRVIAAIQKSVLSRSMCAIAIANSFVIAV